MRLILPDERRDRLAELADRHDASHAALSRMLGRSNTYFSRYLNRKVPYDLAEQDQLRLAWFFGVSPDTMRAEPHAERGRRSR